MKLLNLGPVSEKMLRNAGISGIDDVRRLGAVQAYAIVKRIEKRASLNLLWALAGAHEGVRCNQLTPDARGELLRELDALDDIQQRIRRRGK